MTSPVANPDLSCVLCGDTFLILGDTQPKRNAALAAWRCACTPEPPEPDGLGEGRLAPGHTLIRLALSPYGACMALWLGGGYLAVRSITQ